ncbi:hypothetical protein FHS18_001090 [Paenibacillus phyllosphaerae]|uniref:N-terminal domain of peptidoglycan hydrolase CwlO-containing protein n=1 Tax=Paenibacillus phyllosphaerae TaxID=274593 RepID=A0A7W5AUK2_9BACL|nr:hypothetical protein [Paenibacillus phyllosphaerae]MBB3109038.1 hypothetical protein [Paenibacillus phyllosphaerae]
MRTGMKRRRAGAVLAGAIAVWLTISPAFAAVPSDDEIQSILEKSLSVVELDKEINRITLQKEAASRSLQQSRQALDVQEQNIKSHQAEAGKVLRAYYMGERNILLTALISSQSLDKLLSMLDYIDVLFSSDRQTLDGYLTAYRDLKQSITGLEEETQQLTVIEQQLQAQRARVVALEADVNEQLSGRSDEEKLRLMIEEMTNYWETAGLTEVKRYFKALSQAMKNIPDWLQDHKELLAIDGFNYTLDIPEQTFNSFLREQNELFETLDFTFAENRVTVAGQRDGMTLSISGHYTVEDEPKHGIYFHVDELLFNGLALPDTTRQSLEQEFDLGFYPQKIVSFLKAKSVQVEDGRLIIKFAINL